MPNQQAYKERFNNLQKQKVKTVKLTSADVDFQTFFNLTILMINKVPIRKAFSVKVL